MASKVTWCKISRQEGLNFNIFNSRVERRLGFWEDICNFVGYTRGESFFFGAETYRYNGSTGPGPPCSHVQSGPSGCTCSTSHGVRHRLRTHGVRRHHGVRRDGHHRRRRQRSGSRGRNGPAGHTWSTYFQTFLEGCSELSLVCC